MNFRLIALGLLVSCSGGLLPLENEHLQTFHDRGAAYYAQRLGLSEELFDRIRYFESDDLPVAGQNNHHMITIRSDYSLLCDVVVHEMGHSAAFFKYGDWDRDHCLLGNEQCQYDWLQSVCLVLEVAG